MPESQSHKRAKGRAVGARGKTEVPLKGGRRLDAATHKKAVEVEKSGERTRLEEAARRLRDSRKQQKILQVPTWDMEKAVEAMQKVGVSGTVKNLSGSRRCSVKKSR